MSFKELDVQDLDINPFEAFGSEWGLVTAGDERGYNTMTVAWGAMGAAFGKFTPIVTIFVRPQRVTKQFIDAADRFTLSFYGAGHKRELGVLGTKSGRDTDKVAEVGFTPLFVDGTTAFEQARLVFVCRKLYADELKPERFCDPTVDAAMFHEHDYSTLYIAAIEKVLVREGS